MKLRSLLALATSAALFLSAGRAAAEEEQTYPAGLASMGVDGGLFIFPTVGVAGVIGGGGFGGVQVNQYLAFSAGLDFDFMSGDVRTLHLMFQPAAVLLTFADKIRVGAGPELGEYTTWIQRGVTTTERGGFAYGGRLQLTWHAIEVTRMPDPGKNRALDLSLDLRLRGGGAAFADPWGTNMPGPMRNLAFSPVVTISYSAF